MEIKNKKTGYVFEISDIEGKKLINFNSDEFEPLDKRLLPKKKIPKTVREKVFADSCLNSLTKAQIVQELIHLSVNFNPKLPKKELVELLKKEGRV